MRRLGMVIVVAECLVGASAASFMAVGCSGDDTVVTDGGSDGSQDQTTPDTGKDATPDVAADVAPDATDGGTDSGIPPGLLTWAARAAQAFCEGFAKCCPGGDAGAFNLTQCESDNSTAGWEYSLPTNKSIYDAGHLAYDDDAGTACLNALKAVTCGANNSTEYSTITKACFAVMHGTIPIGSGGCVSSWECAPNSYCDSTVDGGLCTALAAQGQPCGTKAPRDEMCNYLGSGNPGFWCDKLDSADAGGMTCQPLLGNGLPCADPSFVNYYNQACTAQLCGDDGKCGDVGTFPSNAFCQYYSLDAGTD